jgi:serine protease inhibitor
MKFLLLATIALGILWAIGARRVIAAQPGAPRAAEIDDKDVLKAAQFAVTAQQQILSAAGQADSLALVKVVAAKKQVVAGMNYILTLRVKQGDTERTADAKVWVQAWRKDPYKLTAWKFTDEARGDAKPAGGNAPAGAVVTANCGFAADLYQELAKENQGKNLFFSPYSMSSALAMTAEGARGETAAQMGKVLRFPEAAQNTCEEAESLPCNTAQFHEGMAALNERFNSKPVSPELRDKIATLRNELDEANRSASQAMDAQKWQEHQAQAAKSQKLAAELNGLLTQVNRYELRVANALWGEKSYPFEPSYLATIQKFYRTGGAFPTDFKHNPEAARQEINSWVEDQTNKRIQNLIPQGAIDDLTRLVLTNAVYFKGEWKEPFNAGATKEEDFTTAAGTKARVPLMNKGYLGGARYAAFNADGSFFDTPATVPARQRPDPKTVYPGEGGFLMAELPYKGGELSMVVIVPQEADGLASVEKKLSGENLHAWTGKLGSRTVNVYLPKFKLETAYAMKKTLTAMGMTRAFVDSSLPNGAQFDGMCASRDPDLKLYIGAVLHKAFVEVTEKGTEAAAATAVMMPMAAAARVETSVPFIPTIRADKPFLFLIRDMKTGTILFLGRMMKP